MVSASAAVDGVADVEAGEAGGDRPAAAGDGDRAGELQAGRRELLQPQRDRLDHGARRRVVGRGHRVHEERDPAGGRVDRGGALRAGELGDRGLRQRLRRDHGGRRVQRDPAQQLVLLVAASGQQQREREVGDAVDHVGKPAQRGLVEPVGVVDHDRQRAEAGRQPVEAVQDRVVGRAAGRERAGGVGGGAGVGHLDVREQLLDAAERERALELGAAGAQDPLVRRPRRAARSCRSPPAR